MFNVFSWKVIVGVLNSLCIVIMLITMLLIRKLDNSFWYIVWVLILLSLPYALSVCRSRDFWHEDVIAILFALSSLLLYMVVFAFGKCNETTFKMLIILISIITHILHYMICCIVYEYTGFKKARYMVSGMFSYMGIVSSLTLILLLWSSGLTYVFRLHVVTAFIIVVFIVKLLKNILSRVITGNQL